MNTETLNSLNRKYKKLAKEYLDLSTEQDRLTIKGESVDLVHTRLCQLEIELAIVSQKLEDHA